METAQLRYNWADPDVYEAFMGRWSEHLGGSIGPAPSRTCYRAGSRNSELLPCRHACLSTVSQAGQRGTAAGSFKGCRDG